MLLIGLIPTALKRCLIFLSDGNILTFLTPAVIYLGQSSSFLTSTEKSYFSPDVLYSVSGARQVFLVATATSFASLYMLLQSGRFAVTETSKITSLNPTASNTFSPVLNLPLSLKTSSALAPSTSSDVSPSSEIPQNIPSLSTPLSSPFLMTVPSNSLAPSKATGTYSPTSILQFVTI